MGRPQESVEIKLIHPNIFWDTFSENIKKRGIQPVRKRIQTQKQIMHCSKVFLLSTSWCQMPNICKKMIFILAFYFLYGSWVEVCSHYSKNCDDISKRNA